MNKSPFTLGKQERLKSKKQIESLFRSGKAVFIFPYKIFFLLEKNTTPELKMAVSVSKKLFKKAVDRNYIKRLTKESYRLQKSEIKQACEFNHYSLHVLLIYTQKTKPVWKNISDGMEKVMAYLHKEMQSITK